MLTPKVCRCFTVPNERNLKRRFVQVAGSAFYGNVPFGAVSLGGKTWDLPYETEKIRPINIVSCVNL